MKPNIGNTDKKIRILVGLALTIMFFSKAVIGTLGITLLIIGGILLITTIMDFCPLYSIFNLTTKRIEKVDYKQLLARGALIVDVRTHSEYTNGHIKNSLNIPLNVLSNAVKDLDNKIIITCCRSGTRSAIAKSILTKSGIEVYNGGPWNELKEKLT